MKKKFSCMILTVLLAAGVLSGCGSDSAADQIQEREAAQKKTMLTLFLPVDLKSNSAKIYKDVISEYNSKNEDVELRVDMLSTADGFNEALEQRLDEGGKDADIFAVNADSVKALNSKGYFYDLSGMPAYKQLNDAVKEQAVIEGTVYTIPLQMTAYGMLVNTGLLEKNGLKPPKNLDEFLHCCRVLKDNGITPLSLNRWYAMTVPTMARGLYPIYQAENKKEIIDGLNDGSVKIGDYMLEGFRLFSKLVKSGYYGDGLTVEKTDSIKAGTSDLEDFAAEKTAFAFFPIGNEDYIENTAPEMDFMMQGVPVLPNDTVSLPSVSARICVYAKGEHVKEALKAVEYMTSVKAEQIAKDGSGFLPAIQSEKSTKVDPRISRVYEDAVSPGQIPIEDMSVHITYWDTIRELCLDIIGGMSPEDASKKYNRIQKEQLAAYGS